VIVVVVVVRRTNFVCQQLHHPAVVVDRQRHVWEDDNVSETDFIYQVRPE
jgi:hypothetical protein